MAKQTTLWMDEKLMKKFKIQMAENGDNSMSEVIRLKQITGLKEAFANHEFSKSWKEYEKKREKVKLEQQKLL